MPVQPESKFIEVNGLRLRYLDWGNTERPALVCIHGLGGSGEAFNAFARRYRDRFRIVALDARGHGGSAWSPDGAYEYADHASDLTGFLAAVGIERCTLLGTSMGGLIAMTWAGLHPERLDRLGINDIGPDEEAGSLRITQSVAARPAAFANIEDVIAFRARASAITARRSSDDQREAALGVVRQQADGTWTSRLDPEIARQRVERGGGPKRIGLWEALAGVTCPALLFWGEESDVLSGPQAERMVATLPNGTLIRVPGTGHSPSLDEAEALAGLDAFLGAPLPVAR